ncbi:hypothetical protein O7632_30520 [Solwaraspora sp. WMMD406]|uniref:hypothetical protein n=1 Tax=Solwaraspora sp. WMMD406 TaxID=3016095 RepID=UPI002417FB16|nr:hypothetical protein [Solwaraspora sp. WMMD406]MDG4768395.1 hypothetical protein [Solwaraspora sp. WMMD406]
MRSRLAALTVLALVPLLVGTGAAAHAKPHQDADPTGVGVRLLDAPLERRDDYRAHIYIVDHLKPGDVIERRIEVTNYSASAREIALYPGAAVVDKDGFLFGDGRADNELTEWITLDETEVRLDAEHRARVLARITVPDDATSGEHYGVIWAEAGDRRDPNANVHNVARSGVRVYLSIGAGGEPPSDFTLGDLTAQRTSDGQPVISVRVRNTGQRALDLRGELKLTDGPGELSAGPFPVEIATLGIGDDRVIELPLEAVVPDGRWTAKLTLTSGKVHRETTATVAFGSALVESSAAMSPTAVLGISGLVALLAVGALGVVAYRRRDRFS